MLRFKFERSFYLSSSCVFDFFYKNFISKNFFSFLYSDVTFSEIIDEKNQLFLIVKVFYYDSFCEKTMRFPVNSVDGQFVIEDVDNV